MRHCVVMGQRASDPTVMINDIYFFLTKIHTRRINPFPNKPLFLRVCCASLLKTPWDKKKLLVTSNFFFFHSVFYLFYESSAI